MGLTEGLRFDRDKSITRLCLTLPEPGARRRQLPGCCGMVACDIVLIAEEDQLKLIQSKPTKTRAISHIEFANAKASPQGPTLASKSLPSWQQAFPPPWTRVRPHVCMLPILSRRASLKPETWSPCLTAFSLSLPPTRAEEDGVVSGGVKGRKGGGHASRYREVPSASLTTLRSGGDPWLAGPVLIFYINLMEGADTLLCM